MKTAKQKERELIIELNKKGKSTREIAFDLDISKSKAAFWISRYKKNKSLEDMSRSGRPTPLTKEVLDFIAGAIKSQIIKPGKKAGISTKEILELIEDKIKKKYTMRHGERLLHKMGFSLITPRVNHIRKDQKAQDKSRAKFKKNFPKSTWDIQ